MKFCPAVPEICRGQVHGPLKERRKRRRRIRIIIIKIKIIIRNGAKTISLPNMGGLIKCLTNMATLQFQKMFLTVNVRDKRTRCYSYINTYIKELKSHL